MSRVLVWAIFWLLTLGLLRIHVVYKDGLEINIRPWTDLFRKKKRS